MAASEDELTTIASELYRMPPAGFTKERTARARAAKQDGRRELGQAITKLKKPSTAAWVIDALARESPGDLDELSDVAEELGSLQRGERVPGGPAALDERRRTAISRVLRHARDIAKAHEVGVSDAAMDEVEATLRAILADEKAAAAARSGLLVRALQSTGWEPVDLSGALALDDAAVGGAVGEKRSKKASKAPRKKREHAEPQRREHAERKKREHAKSQHAERQQREHAEREHAESEHAERKQREHAERELRDAQQRQREADARLREAASAVHDAESARNDADAAVERLRAELEDAQRRAAQAREVQRSAERDQAAAEEGAAAAQRAVADATKELTKFA